MKLAAYLNKTAMCSSITIQIIPVHVVLLWYIKLNQKSWFFTKIVRNRNHDFLPFNTDNFSTIKICMLFLENHLPQKGIKSVLMDWQQTESCGHWLVNKVAYNLAVDIRQNLLNFIATAHESSCLKSHKWHKNFTWFYGKIWSTNMVSKNWDWIEKSWFLTKIEPKLNRESNFKIITALTINTLIPATRASLGILTKNFQPPKYITYIIHFEFKLQV